MASTKSKNVEYSDADITLLGLLKSRPMSSVELADKYYMKHPPRPRTARQSIVSMMSSLIENVDLNKEPYKIVKAKRSGPNPMEYRRVMR
jgi:hypothetical protein